MPEAARRRSKLVGTHPAEQHEDGAAALEETTETNSEPADNLHRPTGAAPRTQNPRRVSANGRVSDADRVSFNCKMPRGLRRAVRHYATDVEVDIQDVIAAALTEYLHARGIETPGYDLQ